MHEKHETLAVYGACRVRGCDCPSWPLAEAMLRRDRRSEIWKQVWTEGLRALFWGGLVAFAGTVAILAHVHLHDPWRVATLTTIAVLIYPLVAMLAFFGLLYSAVGLLAPLALVMAAVRWALKRDR